MRCIIIKKSNDRFVARATKKDEQYRKNIGEKKPVYVLGSISEGDTPLHLNSLVAKDIIDKYFDDIANTLRIQYI